MAVEIKRVCSLQGITLPNSLHIVDFVHQNKFVDILKLIEFITKQSNQATKNVQTFTGLES